MIPQRIALTNFLRFGENLEDNSKPGVEISFETGEPLWIMSGPNGIGKSAIFDAITYALFGAHRGGDGRGMKELIRHGTNGFRIEFDFDYSGKSYRIIRNYTKKSVERLLVKKGSEWVDVDLVSWNGSVTKWTEHELGLKFEQFIASVLLRQGDADKIITATGSERLKILKQIIGVEQFEQLSNKVRDTTRNKESAHKELQRQVAECPAISAEELAICEAASQAAEDAYALVRKAEEQAIHTVKHAEQHADWLKHRATYAEKLDQAEARRSRATEIRTRFARWSTITETLPKLDLLLKARTTLIKTKPECDQLLLEETTCLEARTTAEKLREESRTQFEHFRTIADDAKQARLAGENALSLAKQQSISARELAEVQGKLQAIPADIAAQVEQAEMEFDEAETDFNSTKTDLKLDEAEFKKVKQQHSEFSQVEVGVECSRCGQIVGPEHAQKELKELADRMTQLESDITAAKAKEASSKSLAAKWKSEVKRLREQAQQFGLLQSQQTMLLRGGALPTVAELEATIATFHLSIQAEQKKEADAREAMQLAEGSVQEAEKQRLIAEKKLTETQKQRAAAEQKLTQAEVQIETLSDTLPEAWHSTGATISADALAALNQEKAELDRSQIAEEHKHLQEDDARRDEWQQQMHKLDVQIAALPETARIPVAQAQFQVKDAKQATAQAETQRDTARSAFQAKQAQLQRREVLVMREREAEMAANIHGKLNKQLGSEGLLRDLVRNAETQIVRYANETARNLSDGDLTIELDDTEDGPDKAFTLKIRRAEDPTPIGVKYLSGSQKFRVSVAVALAIGRFATSGTQSKPIETVIIDEGFGSLDADGLRCMSTELQRLQEHTALKRILLVSHQEEFASQFPVGWALTRAEDGTTIATRFRR